ncbi:MAG: hypothetical protein UV38_C0002G0095 [candidate division TM6 bacterium GW2011_GWE2_42_60]|nr:MAG: hypothetical protein UV38_C0002G0095 [candidate division TM6 bacterium GW2011_GWE2_42_60]HBY06147.1 hypothetical protein [Candidatus Dependentiae bacterium]
MKIINLRELFVLGAVFLLAVMLSGRSDAATSCPAGSFFDRHIAFVTEHGAGRHFYFMFIGFSNEHIEQCRIDIENCGSLEPLRLLWQGRQKELLSDEVVLREFSILLAMVYENLLMTTMVRDQARDLPWFSLMSLYFKLNAIPLAKLFDIIDECLERYKAIFEDYSTHDPRQSLSYWIAENWWLPAMVGAMMVVSFVRWYRDHVAHKSKVQ